MNSRELEMLIRDAFFGRAEDPPAKLVDCRCDECVAIERDLKGRDREALSLHEMFMHNELSLFSAESFHYYLPAYLIASLGDEPEAWDVRAAAIFILKGTTDPRMAPWFEARFSLFTREETGAIVEFLAAIALSDDDLADDASEAHAKVWEPRLRTR